jgi:hypothetical protein
MTVGMPHLRLRKRLGSAPLFADTNDGTAIHFNGKTRPLVGRLLRVGASDQLCLVLRPEFEETFAPFAGYRIDDDLLEVRRLIGLMSAHYDKHWTPREEQTQQAQVQTQAQEQAGA